eukprot:TRINITY_DN19044_c0_g1_i1.p1 TRINITY_DN19044_c0_g1~~TRINITY_DN19044_c0_g1_i1.p1  ORF type:complete len:404 (-),score=142.51 TRINITY_DN19044_c0_g1_i1:95-1237(-)
MVGRGALQFALAPWLPFADSHEERSSSCSSPDDPGGHRAAMHRRFTETNCDVANGATPAMDIAFEQLVLMKRAWDFLHGSQRVSELYTEFNRRRDLESYDWLQLAIADMFFFTEDFRTSRSIYERLHTRLRSHLADPISAPQRLVPKRGTAADAGSAGESAVPVGQRLLRSLTTRYNVELASLRMLLQVARCALCTGDVRAARSILLNIPVSLPFIDQLPAVRPPPAARRDSWIVVRLSESELILQTICNLIQCYESLGDLGKATVLMQFAWPRFEPKFREMLSSQRFVNGGFKFHHFFNYVVNIEILEEFAYCLNRGLEMHLLPEDTWAEIVKQNAAAAQQSNADQLTMIEMHIASSYGNPDMTPTAVLEKFFNAEIKT